MKRVGAVVAVALWSFSGCTALTAGQVTYLKPPPVDGLAGKGCTVSVAPTDASGYELDGARPGEPSAERRRALAAFDDRFYGAVANIDPAHMQRGERGKLVMRPRIARIVSGTYFSDAAGAPTQVWLRVELTDAAGAVLEELEVQGVQGSSRQQPTLDDRLPAVGASLGEVVGKYVRKQLSCR